MKQLKEFVKLSKREFQAVSTIIFLLIVFMIIRLLLPHINFIQKTNLKDFEKEINDFEKSAQSTPKYYDENYVTDYSKNSLRHNADELELFKFDPNTTDSLGFLKLGFSAKQAKVICNFRRKNGVFFSKESFKKMYCISAKMYQKLEPYIIIDPPKKFKLVAQNDSNKFFIKKTKLEQDEPLVFEVNDADTISLKRLKGIGSSFAKRIVAYREKLGGYFHKKQFLEIYGMDTTLFFALQKQLIIDTLLIKKININKASFYTLKSFPYLSKNQASALLNYRDNHGEYKLVSDLKKCLLINNETYNKIRPYIKTHE